LIINSEEGSSDDELSFIVNQSDISKTELISDLKETIQNPNSTFINLKEANKKSKFCKKKKSFKELSIDCSKEYLSEMENNVINTPKSVKSGHSNNNTIYSAPSLNEKGKIIM
jgi:hypothetical protein